MSLLPSHVAGRDRNPTVRRRNTLREVGPTQPRWPMQTEIPLPQDSQLGRGRQFGSQTRMHANHLGMFHHPWQRREQLGVRIRNRLPQSLQVARLDAVGPKRRLALVSPPPPLGPLGLDGYRHQPERTGHSQVVVATDSSCPRVRRHQFQHTLDDASRIGSTINQVAQEYDPTIAEVTTSRRSVEQLVQQAELSMDVADQQHWTFDPAGQRSSRGCRVGIGQLRGRGHQSTYRWETIGPDRYARRQRAACTSSESCLLAIGTA